MTIEIYRKHYINGIGFEDETAETIYKNVSDIQITSKYIFGNIDGEQLTIKTDHFNYAYTIQG